MGGSYNIVTGMQTVKFRYSMTHFYRDMLLQKAESSMRAFIDYGYAVF